MDEHCPFFWRHCQQQLKLSDSRLRALMLLPAHQRAHVLNPDEQRSFRRCLDDPAGAELLRLGFEQAGIGLVCLTQATYPPLLREIHDPPPLLYYRGCLDICDRPTLAVVGSRRPSRAGQRDAEMFARELAAVGFVVVSGLALGVDGAAHRGALAVDGATIAVLGCGIDIPYPRSHLPLYREIAESGLLISELPPGKPPLRHQFPRRNRIISGLSLGVLVVEAAQRSGSLITARMALEQNREVFALPGSIHNPCSRGCNDLIRQGARLVENLADIVEAFSGWVSGELPAAGDVPAAVSPPADSRLLPLLSFEPQPVDRLARHSGLSLAAILGELAELELDGWVEQRAGAWLRCR